LWPVKTLRKEKLKLYRNPNPTLKYPEITFRTKREEDTGATNVSGGLRRRIKGKREEGG
jgi:hypothetical protein